MPVVVVVVVGSALFGFISWLGNVDEEKDLKFSKHPIGQTKSLLLQMLSWLGKGF